MALPPSFLKGALPWVCEGDSLILPRHHFASWLRTSDHERLLPRYRLTPAIMINFSRLIWLGHVKMWFSVCTFISLCRCFLTFRHGLLWGCCGISGKRHLCAGRWHPGSCARGKWIIKEWLLRFFTSLLNQKPEPCHERNQEKQFQDCKINHTSSLSRSRLKIYLPTITTWIPSQKRHHCCPPSMMRSISASHPQKNATSSRWFLSVDCYPVCIMHIIINKCSRE